MTWLLAFAIVFALDLCWAAYTKQVTAGAAGASALWAAALYLIGAAATVSYVNDSWLLIPCAAGAFCGTYSGVWWEARRAAKKQQLASTGTAIG